MTGTNALTTVSPFSSWRIDHAALRVPDFDEAVAWYTETLDFRLTKTASIGPLTFGYISPAADDRFSFELLAGPGAAERPTYETLHDSYNLFGWHHLGIRVDNVAETIAELKRRGVTIVTEPREVPVLGLRVAFFSDPWGNIMEVIEPLGANPDPE